MCCVDVQVLVFPTRQVHQYQVVEIALRGEIAGRGYGVGRLHGRDDPLQPAESLERLQGGAIVGEPVLDSTRGVEVGVLRANARVVQPGRDAVGGCHLAVLVLEQVAHGAVEDAHIAVADASRVLAEPASPATSLHPDQPTLLQ